LLCTASFRQSYAFRWRHGLKLEKSRGLSGCNRILINHSATQFSMAMMRNSALSCSPHADKRRCQCFTRCILSWRQVFRTFWLLDKLLLSAECGLFLVVLLSLNHEKQSTRNHAAIACMLVPSNACAHQKHHMHSSMTAAELLSYPTVTMILL